MFHLAETQLNLMDFFAIQISGSGGYPLTLKGLFCQKIAELGSTLLFSLTEKICYLVLSSGFLLLGGGGQHCDWVEVPPPCPVSSDSPRRDKNEFTGSKGS